MGWAVKVCDALIAQGHWADYIDPCSGLPVGGVPHGEGWGGEGKGSCRCRFLPTGLFQTAGSCRWGSNHTRGGDLR